MIDSLDHHAYGLAGNAETVLPKLIASLEKLGVTTKGNPDFRIERYETMGIDEARVLKEASERTAVSGGKKVFIVSVKGITREAQNALLKVFEEPAQNTHFFLIVPVFEILLPTLRSRLSLVRAENAEAQVSSEAERFLEASVPARLKTIQALLKAVEEEEGKQTLVAFLDGLEQTLATKERSSTAQALTEVLEAKRYSRDRAPSFKLLLEHLALVLPKI